MIIGLSGYARSGKDAFATELLDVARTRGHRTRRFRFSDALKQFTLDIDPQVCGIPLSVVFEAHDSDWEVLKDHHVYGYEVRRILQNVGTEARNTFYPDVWVDKTVQGISDFWREDPHAPPPVAVVTDVRFPNEADAIRDAGGQVLRISRPGIKAVNAHVSEHALEGYTFDGYVHNDRDLAHLRLVAQEIIP